jgi:orotate phosphoribosyltransferase
MDNRLDKDAVKKILEGREAIITDSHFVYSQPTGHGDHGSAYVNKDAIYPDPGEVSKLCLEMAYRLKPVVEKYAIGAVVGPEKGALILSSWLSYHLWNIYGSDSRYAEHYGTPMAAVYAEKDPAGGFVIKRGYDKLVHEREGKVIVVEDILNSGGTVSEVLKTVRNLGGDPVAVVAICNRGGVTAESLGVPFLDSLLNVPLQKWPEADCPLCKKGVPVRTDLGHGKDFQKRKGAMSPV